MPAASAESEESSVEEIEDEDGLDEEFIVGEAEEGEQEDE